MNGVNIVVPQVSSIEGSMMAGIMQQGQTAGGSDLFAMLLQQLLGGEQGETDGLFAAFQQAAEDTKEEGTDLASQMMAELMAGGLNFNSDWITQADMPTEQLAQQVLQSGGATASGVQNLLTSLGQIKNPEDLDAVLQRFQMMQTSAADERQNAQAMPVTELQLQIPVSQEKGEESQSQMQFYNAITEVKKQMETDKQVNGEDPSDFKLNVEQLQQDVNAGRYNPLADVAKVAAKPMEAPDLLNQVETGIKQNLQLEKNEFQVKLKPEGMGEITVKLVESGDKMALSIVTSNAQVAKILNSSIAELRENLRVYNTDVQEIVAQQQYNQQDGFQHNFARQNQQQMRQHHHNRSSVGWDDLLVEDPLMEEVTGQLASQLDAYI